jgi:hypothetical protein
MKGNPAVGFNAAGRLLLLFQNRARTIAGINIFAAVAGLLSPMYCIVRKTRHVKIRMCENRAGGNGRSEAPATKKKPGTAGLSDESHFRSVHFASLAI